MVKPKVIEEFVEQELDDSLYCPVHQPKRCRECRVNITTEEDRKIYVLYFIELCCGKTIIYCTNTNDVCTVQNLLEAYGHEPVCLYPFQPRRLQDDSYQRFLKDLQGTLVATDGTLIGRQLPYVDRVIHYTAPPQARTYERRLNETTRKSNRSYSIMLFAKRDVRRLQEIYRELHDLPLDEYYFHKATQKMQVLNKLESANMFVRKNNMKGSIYEKEGPDMYRYNGKKCYTLKETSDNIDTLMKMIQVIYTKPKCKLSPDD